MTSKTETVFRFLHSHSAYALFSPSPPFLPLFPLLFLSILSLALVFSTSSVILSLPPIHPSNHPTIRPSIHPFILICMYVYVLLLSYFSRVRLCATPQTAAHQAPPSLGFSRQEHWSGFPFLYPMHEGEKRK